jgi:hypothetical protein
VWENLSETDKKKKNLASYSYRTATTAHPCYIPVLGDSAGAGRIRPARAAKVYKYFFRQKLNVDFIKNK